MDSLYAFSFGLPHRMNDNLHIAAVCPDVGHLIFELRFRATSAVQLTFTILSSPARLLLLEHLVRNETMLRRIQEHAPRCHVDRQFGDNCQGAVVEPNS